MTTKVQNMEELILIDAETNEDFKLIVSSTDAARARNDLTFATQLMKHARQSTNSNSQIPSSSSCISLNACASSSKQKIAANLDTTDVCAEGVHAWTKQETLLLLELYREYQTDFVGGKGTVKKHWENIAKHMQEKGYNISGFKCSTKFQSLKRTYKCIMDHNKKSGNNRKDWEYLQIMQELFDDKPWMQPLAVAGSHLGETENEIDMQDEEENIPDKISVSKKTKFNTVINDYISFSKEERTKRRETRAKQHTEKLLAFQRIENLLERLVEKEKKSEY